MQRREFLQTTAAVALFSHFPIQNKKSTPALPVLIDNKWFCFKFVNKLFPTKPDSLVCFTPIDKDHAWGVKCSTTFTLAVAEEDKNKIHLWTGGFPLSSGEQTVFTHTKNCLGISLPNNFKVFDSPSPYSRQYAESEQHDATVAVYDRKIVERILPATGYFYGKTPVRLETKWSAKKAIKSPADYSGATAAQSKPQL